jgi:hypothetical protein
MLPVLKPGAAARYDTMHGLVLKPGSLARYDSFQGLFPCKVLSIRATEFGNRATIRFTRDNPLWCKGDVMEASTLSVVPRQAVFRRGGRFMIGPYTVELGARP